VGTVHNNGSNLSLTAVSVAAVLFYTHNPFRIPLPQCITLPLPTVCVSASVLVASRFSPYTMIENIVRITSEYEARLARSDYVPRFSYGRRMLRDDDDPNRFFLMYLFCEEPNAIPFLKDIGLLRSTMKCNSCGRDMTWSADPRFLKDFVGDVKGGLLGSSAVGLRLLRHGSSRVISPSKKLCSSHTTSCAAKNPPRSKKNTP